MGLPLFLAASSNSGAAGQDIDTLIKQDDLYNALTEARKISTPSLKDERMGMFVKLFICRLLFPEAVFAAESISDIGTRDTSLGEIAIKKVQIAFSQKMLIVMQPGPVIVKHSAPSSDERWEMVEDALQIAEKITDLTLKTCYLEQIAEFCIEKSRPKYARLAIKRISDIQKKDLLLVKCVERLPPEYYGDEMRAAARAITDPDLRSRVESKIPPAIF
jgi:hypothetical protein